MKNLAIVQIVLGGMVIAAHICPSPVSDIVLGILVMVVGGIILKKSWLEGHRRV